MRDVWSQSSGSAMLSNPSSPEWIVGGEVFHWRFGDDWREACESRQESAIGAVTVSRISLWNTWSATLGALMITHHV